MADGAILGVAFQFAEDEPRKLGAAIRNVNNLTSAFGAGVPVVVVAHGAGMVAALETGPVAAEVASVLASGVDVRACANTLERKSIPESVLAPGIDTVPSGIAELVEKQWAGWAYVRP